MIDETTVGAEATKASHCAVEIGQRHFAGLACEPAGPTPSLRAFSRFRLWILPAADPESSSDFELLNVSLQLWLPETGGTTRWSGRRRHQRGPHCARPLPPRVGDPIDKPTADAPAIGARRIGSDKP